MKDSQLLHEARRVLVHAYAPYSGYRVAAALLAGDGKVYTGVNVENASYGLTLCAERAALVAAVSAGQRRFSTLGVVSEKKPDPVPCGACRQALAEFAPDCRVLVSAAGGEETLYRLADLLPRPFSYHAETNHE